MQLSSTMCEMFACTLLKKIAKFCLWTNVDGGRSVCFTVVFWFDIFIALLVDLFERGPCANDSVAALTFCTLVCSSVWLNICFSL